MNVDCHCQLCPYSKYFASLFSVTCPLSGLDDYHVQCSPNGLDKLDPFLYYFCSGGLLSLPY